MQTADVKRFFAFALHFDMFNARISTGHDFGDGIGEINALARRSISFDNGCARAIAHQNEVARVRHAGRFAVRQKQQMNRRFELHVGADLNEGAILCERGIERGESFVFRVQNLAEMFLHDFVFAGKSRRETYHRDAFAQSLQAR